MDDVSLDHIFNVQEQYYNIYEQITSPRKNVQE